MNRISIDRKYWGWLNEGGKEKKSSGGKDFFHTLKTTTFCPNKGDNPIIPTSGTNMN